MIKSFKDKETKKIFDGQHSRRFPPDIQRKANAKLQMIEAVRKLEDLRFPPGNKFEALEGRPGYFSIRVNIQWRITFSWNDGAENVRLEDYH